MKGFINLFLIFFIGLSFASLKDIFKREGYIVEVSGNEVIIDLGEDKVREGEIFNIVEAGDRIVHPWTGNVIGIKYKIKGKIVITKVKEGYSYAKLIEGEAKKGDKIKIEVNSVCFIGSDEGFFEAGVQVSHLRRGNMCEYMIKELKDGFGIEFNGFPLAYVKTAVVKEERMTKEEIKKQKDLRITNVSAKASLIGTLSDIPLSADAGDIYGDGKDYLVILFEDRIEIFEMHEKEMVKRDSIFLPAGYPAYIKVARINKKDKKDYILLNMVEGDKAKSYVIKMVENEPVFIVRDIPFFINVLNKENPEDTFVGQKVEFPKWGSVFKAIYEEGKVKEAGKFKEYEDFPIDGAFYYNNYLCFIDTDGVINVVKEGVKIFSGSLNLRSSYNYIKYGEDEDTAETFYFSNPISVVNVGKTNIILAGINERSKASELFDLPLFKKGSIYFGNIEGDNIYFKKVEGEEFEQSVQTILQTKEGDVIVISAFRGGLNLSRGGNIYRLSLSAGMD